jgi:mitogen-activated protein kinase kinase
MEQSLLHTHVGCERYLAPERLDPMANRNEYGTESDVWSYGVTLVELGMLDFPYVYKKAFEVLTKIVSVV